MSASGGLPTIAWLLMAVHVCSLNEHNHEDGIHLFIAFSMLCSFSVPEFSCVCLFLDDFGLFSARFST